MEIELENKWLAMCDKAQYRKGVSDTGNHIVPDWYDHDKFVEAQKFMKKDIFGVLMPIYNGLTYAMAHKGLSGPHLFAESMANMERISKFMIGIMNQIMIWLNGDLFDPKDKAYQSIRNVRSIHSHIGKKMNEREGRVEGKDVLWINQLEMFVLPLRAMEIGLVFPDHFRSTTKTQEGKEKTFYWFRVLGYCMGIEEQFNLFSWPIEDMENIARYDFWTNIYPVIVNRDNLFKIKTNSMNQELFDKRFHKLFYYVWKKEVYYMANVSKADKSVLGKKKKLIGYLLLKNKIMLNLPNSFVLFAIRQAIKQKRPIMKMMKKIPM